MLRKPLLSLFAALALIAVFVVGLVRLFVLRYEVGDVYPEYSTLRADPLGAKALVDALAQLPHVEVGRNFKPLPKLRPEGPVTLVYAGVDRHSYWTDAELMAFDSLLANGSRAVFTFFPVEKTPSTADDRRSDEKEERKREEGIGRKTGQKRRRQSEGQGRERRLIERRRRRTSGLDPVQRRGQTLGA
jgi:hypothetical protein